jgi:8-oxo-dGTP pyrophosphatase MutT (NUDIX family)
MTTESTYTSKRTGLKWNIKYQELDSFDSIRNLPIGAAGAFCFCGDKFVVVYAGDNRNVWEIPGGGIEEGETFEECIIREIHEESNMKVLELFPLGYETQHCVTTNETYYILRYAARVEPYGPFVSDPANGEITEIKLIDPKEYKQYFDWGKRSDVLMEKAMKVLNLGSI